MKDNINRQRACDRCYKVKTSCVYEQSTDACMRCTRLGHKCETRRAVLQPGRPRSFSKSNRSLRQIQQSFASPGQEFHTADLIISPSLSPWLTRFQEHEVMLLQFLLHPDQVSSLLYGQTFQKSLQASLASQCFFASDQLKDGLLALAKALSRIKNVHFDDASSGSQHEHGSRALQLFSKAQTRSLEDAHTILGHAIALVTYNDIVAGLPTLPISRSALLQILPWRTQLICSTTEETDPSIICILFVEAFECLLHAQRPVFRYEPPSENMIVDRYYGICHDLLPELYDICSLYKAIKAGEMSREEVASRVQELTECVTQWSPDSAMEMRAHTIEDVAEKDHFLLQAKAFKTAVQLLLLQAQRSPLTDMLARAKAEQVEQHISNSLWLGIGRPKYLLFPYFVACLELEAPNDDIQNLVLQRMHEISNGMAPRACQSMVACLKDIWRNKQRWPGLTWFECISDGQIIVMGP